MQAGGPRCLVFLIALAAISASSAATGPVSVAFDDIDASLADVPIVSPYQGLSWANLTAYAAVPGFAGFNNGIVSGPNAAYGGGETAGPGVAPIVSSITALSGQAFDFLGASFGAGYYDTLSLSVTGSFQGALVGSQTLTLSTTGAVFSAFSFTRLDTLTFTALRTTASADPFACGIFNCTQFTIDDASFVISDLPVSNVPEPATTALLAAGLSALALRWRLA